MNVIQKSETIKASLKKVFMTEVPKRILKIRLL